MKIFTTLIAAMLIASAGTVTCIDYGTMTICTNSETGEQITIIKY